MFPGTVSNEHTVQRLNTYTQTTYIIHIGTLSLYSKLCTYRSGTDVKKWFHVYKIMFCTAPSPARRNIPAFFVAEVLQLSSQRSFHAEIYLFLGKIISPYRHYVFQHDYVRRDICCHFLLMHINNFAIIFLLLFPCLAFLALPCLALPCLALPCYLPCPALSLPSLRRQPMQVSKFL